MLFLWSQNLGEVTPVDVVRTLTILLAVVGGATWLMGRLLGDVRRGALVIAPLVFGLLMFGQLVRLLDGPDTALESIEMAASGPATVGGVPSSVVVGVSLIVLAALGIILALRLSQRRLAALDSALTGISAILVVVTLVPTGAYLIGSTPHRTSTGAGIDAATDIPGSSVDGGARPTSDIPGSEATVGPLRDVYWLIFDRYGSDRSMALRYDIQNDLTPWLIERGFTILADSHANYPSTAPSLATTANMKPIEELEGWVGPESHDLALLSEALDGPLVARQFKALGYRYLTVGSWWPPTSTDPYADANYNAADVTDFNAALFDESALPTLAEVAGLENEAPSFPRRHWINGRYELEALERIKDEPGPKFVLAHVLLPHPPQVFQRDGSFTTTGSGLQGFRDQLAYTNDRLRSILTGLVTLPADRRPIIILQADEGPYIQRASANPCCFDWATATGEELEIKFGIMNAWYLPDGKDIGLYSTMTAINTFPVLFDGYFGLDYDRLPDRVFTAPNARLLDFTDVTDRLPSLP